MSSDRSLAAPEAPQIRSIVDAFEHPVALVAIDGEITLANAAWRDAVGTGSASPGARAHWRDTPLLALPPAFEMLHAAAADGSVRHFDLDDERHDRRYRVRVAPAGAGHLLIELFAMQGTRPHIHPNGVADDHGAPTQSLATRRELAAAREPATILEVVARAAVDRCHAAGAAVITVKDDSAELVASSGVLSVARGRRFTWRMEDARAAMRDRHPVSGDVLALRAPLFAATGLHEDIGAMLAAPLLTHEGALGVLLVVRRRAALPFSDRERNRLELLADQAALALWKAALLARAQDADLAKSRFIATVSHELRTPLTALTGYEELLADEVLGPLTEAQGDVVERMRVVTHHLTVMIEELLAFSSLETGRETVRATDFLAADLVRAAAAVVAPQAAQKKLRLEVDVPPEPIRMSSDVDKIRQILVNLAGNAVKFTDAGSVTLGVAAEGDHVRFTVRDTGIGIGEADVARLFRPFAQLDAGLTRRHGGTGLGLYISQRLVTMLGGEVDVVSVLGRGSEFSVRLPREL